MSDPAEAVFRRIGGEPPRNERERLEWAVDDYAVAVMAAMRDTAGPFGARIADAKAKLLGAIDRYAKDAAGLPDGMEFRPAAVWVCGTRSTDPCTSSNPHRSRSCGWRPAQTPEERRVLAYLEGTRGQPLVEVEGLEVEG